MNDETLFELAINTPEAERAAMLDRECAGKPDLRQRIEALLAAHGALGRLPQVTGAYTPEPDEAGHTIDQRPAGEAGDVIAGRYTLVENIGEGGMGKVWVAQQSEPVKRSVALKLIKAGMDTKAVLQRFDAERQALAMMDHPNIAKVFDGGMTADRRPFFVMELVNGLALTKFCDEAKLGIRQRLELFVAICQGVQHAHQKGVVHRDLKPSNILVTNVDGRPVPKIIDFGVAKAVGGRLTNDSLFTDFGAVVGTLEYMSPEQAGVTGDDVDTRADIFSLGVVLYELLTGLQPIDSKRLREAALTEMIRIIREEEPSKPSTRLSTAESLPSVAALRHTEPASLMAVLRGELDWVVMKCLEKDRSRRYETANGLARDLQRFLADEPVEARPPSVGYRLRKFIRRNRGAVAAATVVLFALLATAAISCTAAVMIWREQKQTEAERNKATENAEAAIKVVRDLSAYVHMIEFSGRQAAPTAEQRKKSLDATLASYQRLFALHPDDAEIQSSVARTQRYRANVSRSVNDTVGATESYREALRHYGELVAAYPETPRYRDNVSETSRDFGMFLSGIGRLKEATELLDQSVRANEELLRSSPNDAGYQRRLALVLIDRADLDYQLGRYPDCEKAARAAADLYELLAKTPGSHPETLDPLFHAMARNRLAVVLREQGKVDEAIAVHDGAVSQLAAAVKVNATRDFLHLYHRCRAERAWTLSGIPDRRGEAVKDLDEASIGYEKLAKQFPDSPLYRHYQCIVGLYRGRLESLLGQRDAAARDLGAAALVLTGLVEKYKDISAYRYDLGRIYIALGQVATDPTEASRAFGQARPLLEATVQRSPENVQYRQALNELNALTRTKQ
jgi:serine/threonine protein kinase